ncbi:ATP-binding protein [Marivivens donghaensis]|uniref:ATP-binding protein n=1 Tax=Marivivens donghaensis TaxID=1699413 RepID=UPI00201F5E97|nr:ATP-binding protein [Marivivens donghaensis]MCL7408874.1 ATP-binding protein [Marivivens donghaensis]MDN3703828.1 ATP-binding protein [Marivivens donghaensis]
MAIGSIKSYLPRGLYGRAALILLLPIISLQILVSVVFIQRHYDGVTRRMTQSVSGEITLILDSPSVQQAALSEALWFTLLSSEAPPEADDYGFLDFSGRAMIATLRTDFDDLRAVDLSDDTEVVVWFDRSGVNGISFPRWRVTASNPHQLIVIMMVMGTFLTFVAYSFLRNQLRPIKRLAHASSEYGKGRIVPYSPGGANEVRAAGTAFLDMRARIERQTQSRTMMLSGISHDLRTPLTRLRLGLSMVDDAEAEPMVRDVEDMERLIEAFLEYGRADAGDAAEQVDVVDLVTRVVDDAQRGGQNVTLLPIDPTLNDVAVPLRPLAVRRALDNLIGNALRYGGTQAQVSVALTDRTLRITVEDDGPGIPADKREEAMRPFTRLDPARNQNKGTGVGLGLAIVADIARLHGGVLRLSDSPALGGLRADIVMAR